MDTNKLRKIMNFYQWKQLLKFIFKISQDYRDNQKTLKQEDDFKNQVITLKSSMSTRHSNCAV